MQAPQEVHKLVVSDNPRPEQVNIFSEKDNACLQQHVLTEHWQEGDGGRYLPQERRNFTRNLLLRLCSLLKKQTIKRR